MNNPIRLHHMGYFGKPSGKHTQNDGTSPFLMGKSVTNYQRVEHDRSIMKRTSISRLPGDRHTRQVRFPENLRHLVFGALAAGCIQVSDHHTSMNENDGLLRAKTSNLMA